MTSLNANLVLTDRRMILTAPEEEAACRLAERLREQGALVSHIPLIEIVPVSFDLPAPSRPLDWLFFTSKNGVRSFFSAPPLALEPFRALPVAAVGPATGRILESVGVRPAFLSPQFDGDSAARAFLARHAAPGLRILWPCGNRANEAFARTLEQAGAQVRRLVVYETRLQNEETLSEANRQALFPCSNSPSEAQPVLIFSSPSAVHAYERLAPRALASTPALIAGLGPRTAEALRQVGAPIAIQPDNSTFDHLYDALLRYFSG